MRRIRQNRTTDLTGRTFGRWTVLRRATLQEEQIYAAGCSYWLCECACGSQALVNGQMLRCGRSKSCGCLRREIMTGNQYARRDKGETL